MHLLVNGGENAFVLRSPETPKGVFWLHEDSKRAIMRIEVAMVQPTNHHLEWPMVLIMGLSDLKQI